jgi:hypothetical protein
MLTFKVSNVWLKTFKNLDLDLRFSSDDDDGSPSEPEDNGRGLFPE